MGFWSRVKERMKTRNPWVAGFLNLFWGLGYLYAGRKKLVGVSFLMLIGAWVIAGQAFLNGSISTEVFYLLIGVSILFVSLTLARDAYLETKERNEEVESE